MKLENSFHSLVTANNTEDAINEVSDRSFHQTVNKKVTVNTINGKFVKKKK